MIEDIKQLLQDYSSAICNKDAAGVIRCYTKDAVAYDLAPPLVQKKELFDPSHLQEWFDTWEGPISSVPHDMHMEVSEDLAFGYCLLHMTGKRTDGIDVDFWFRSTVCLKKDITQWKIRHVHNSVPFAMDGSFRALVDLKP